MSIYFYASDGDEIKALCGVKALIIRKKNAKQIKNKLDNISQEKLSAKALEAEYKGCLEQNILSKELREEYNHFKCLGHSKTVNFFYIRNFMLRLTYSSYIRKKITNSDILPHSILRDVLRYFTDYAHFHYAAYPFIEVHHLLISEKEQVKKAEGILYSHRIDKARSFLLNHPENLKDKSPSYRSVGTLVDRNFCLLLRMKRETFAKLEYAHTIDRKYLKKCNSFFLLYRMFMRLLKRPRLWINIARVLLSRTRLLFPHILKRLFAGGPGNRNSRPLPAILSNSFIIDPVAFPYKKQYIKGQERPYPSSLHSGLANLLWHILSRCAVITCFLAFDVPENDIYFYFKKLRRFNWEWRERAREAEFELSHLDTEIIEQVTAEYRIPPPYSPWRKIAKLEEIAIAIFKKYRGEAFFDLRDPSSPGNAALNCAYMHI